MDGMGGGGGGLMGGVTDIFHGLMGGIFGDTNTAPQMPPTPATMPQGAWPGYPVPQQGPPTQSYPGFSGSLAGPGQAEGYFASLGKPGPTQSAQYFNQAMMQQQPQVSQNAQGAYNAFLNQVPADTSPYYNYAVQRGGDDLNARYAAMGLGSSSAAGQAQTDLISQLRGQQALADANYGLQRAGLQGSLASGADSSSGLRANSLLGWLTGLGSLAGNADQSTLAQTLGYGNLAGQAQSALTGRAQGYFDNLMNLAGQQAGAMTGISNQMLGTNLGLFDQAMQAYLGYPRQALNQGASDRASSEQGLGALAGILGAFMSDVRTKNELDDEVPGMEFIEKLRPVNFVYRHDGQAEPHSGFMAQEVEAAARESGFEFSGVMKEKGKPYQLQYAEFVAPMIKAMQEQQAEIRALRKRLEENGL